jgi:hypothetical protein
LIADEIKGWDKKGVDDSRSFHYSAHVGANYFDVQGNPTDPEKNKSALADEGGNTFTLELSDEPPRGRGISQEEVPRVLGLRCGERAIPSGAGQIAEKELEAQIDPLKQQLVHEMATHEPHNWQMPSNVLIESYAEI